MENVVKEDLIAIYNGVNIESGYAVVTERPIANC
jgi:hypothetical protein